MLEERVSHMMLLKVTELMLSQKSPIWKKKILLLWQMGGIGERDVGSVPAVGQAAYIDKKAGKDVTETGQRKNPTSEKPNMPKRKHEIYVSLIILYQLLELIRHQNWV